MTGAAAFGGEGGPVVAVEAALADDGFVELLGRVGFDAVVINASTEILDPLSASLERMVRAADAAGVIPVVLLHAPGPGAVGKALAFGAAAVLVAGIDGAQEAERVVSWARYPPYGVRGAAPFIRAAGYGTVPWPDYTEQANRSPVVGVVGSAAEAEALAGAGLDGLVASAAASDADAARIAARAVADGGIGGAWGREPDRIAPVVAAGGRLIVAGDDHTLMSEAAARLRGLLDDARRSV